MNDLELLTRTEVAKLLRVSTGTVHKLARARMIDHMRVGKRLLFPKSAVTAFLESRLIKTQNSATDIAL